MGQSPFPDCTVNSCYNQRAQVSGSCFISLGPHAGPICRLQYRRPSFNGTSEDWWHGEPVILTAAALCICFVHLFSILFLQLMAQRSVVRNTEKLHANQNTTLQQAHCCCFQWSRGLTSWNYTRAVTCNLHCWKEPARTLKRGNYLNWTTLFCAVANPPFHWLRFLKELGMLFDVDLPWMPKALWTFPIEAEVTRLTKTTSADRVHAGPWKPWKPLHSKSLFPGLESAGILTDPWKFQNFLNVPY